MSRYHEICCNSFVLVIMYQCLSHIKCKLPGSNISDGKRERTWKKLCSVPCVSAKCNGKSAIKCTPSTVILCSASKVKLARTL